MAPRVVRIRPTLVNKDEYLDYGAMSGQWAHGAELNPKGALQMPSRCFVILSPKSTELKARCFLVHPRPRDSRSGQHRVHTRL